MLYVLLNENDMDTYMRICTEELYKADILNECKSIITAFQEIRLAFEC